LHYTASGIITHIGGRLVHRLRVDWLDLTIDCNIKLFLSNKNQNSTSQYSFRLLMLNTTRFIMTYSIRTQYKCELSLCLYYEQKSA